MFLKLLPSVGDSCRGDSGAPLWIWIDPSIKAPNDELENENNENTQEEEEINQSKPSITKKAVFVGIVSRGKGCGLKNRPGIYTRVKSFMSWIKEEAKLGNCSE